MFLNGCTSYIPDLDLTKQEMNTDYNSMVWNWDYSPKSTAKQSRLALKLQGGHRCRYGENTSRFHIDNYLSLFRALKQWAAFHWVSLKFVSLYNFCSIFAASTSAISG